MRLTDTNGNRVWLNPHRIDSVETCNVGTKDEPTDGVRVTTPNRTITTTDDFETLTKALEAERGSKP